MLSVHHLTICLSAGCRRRPHLQPDGLQIAVVNNGKSEIRKVSVTCDLGTQVEVDAGVKPGDRVIRNPPVNLVEGSKMQLAAQ
jgi:hypothetical protein